MMYLAPLLSLLLYTGATATPREKFYVIAHMANNENGVGWALAAGANALEIDVTFSSTGLPAHAHHGTPCDCSCFITVGMCQFPDICTGSRPIGTLLNYIMQHALREQVALIYLDCKMGAVSNGNFESAGEQVVKVAEQYLFQAGYSGKVVIGGGRWGYMESLVKTAAASPYHSQIYMTYDMFSYYTQALDYMARLNYTRKMFSIGMSACAPTSYYKETALGAVNKARGVISEVIDWTVDRVESFDKYYESGGRGVITNDVNALVSWTRDRGIPLYTPNDTVAETTRGVEALALNLGTCTCVANGTGCVVSRPAPGYAACQCQYEYDKCSATVTGCLRSADPLCVTPDASYKSCLLGSGDCTGYAEHGACDCDWYIAGCLVTVLPVPGKACRCTSYYKSQQEPGLKRHCEGQVVECRDPAACHRPDKTLQFCLQGGGDCGGYLDTKCQCGAGSGQGGCVITRPAPTNTSCHCDYSSAGCYGNPEQCREASAGQCLAPSTTSTSCLFGTGNCGGYERLRSCDCTYQKGGCKISQAAGSGSACRCNKSAWWWSCWGEVVGCTHPHLQLCLKPDTSAESCHLGGGNCGAYRYY